MPALKRMVRIASAVSMRPPVLAYIVPLKNLPAFPDQLVDSAVLACVQPCLNREHAVAIKCARHPNPEAPRLGLSPRADMDTGMGRYLSD
jgi:hypothetical protein